MKVYLLLTCLFHSSPSSHDIQASPPRSELVQTTNTTESPNRTITSHVSCTNPIDSVIKPITKASPNRSLHRSDLGWSVCLPTTLCCLLVYHYMFRAGRVDVDVRLEQVRRGRMVSAGRSILFALCIWVPFGGSGKILAGEMAGGRVSFSDTTGYMSKIRMCFCGKVAPTGCTQHIFRLGRVKTCVDQSAQLISRWM